MAIHGFCPVLLHDIAWDSWPCVALVASGHSHRGRHWGWSHWQQAILTDGLGICRGWYRPQALIIFNLPNLKQFKMFKMFKLEPCPAPPQYQCISSAVHPRRQHLAWDCWMCQEDPAGHWPKDAGAGFCNFGMLRCRCFSKFAQIYWSCFLSAELCEDNYDRYFGRSRDGGGSVTWLQSEVGYVM